jgi:hypothetical protein
MPVATTVEQKNPRQLSDGNTAGTILGQGPGDNISAYNATPQPQILQGSLAGANGLLTIYTTSQSPASVLANTTGERAMTVTGVAATDMVIAVNKPTSQAGLAVGTARVSATNTVQVSFGNVTAATITPTTTESYTVVTASAALQLPAVTLSPASVAAATTVEQTFTVTGVQPGMVVSVTKPTVQAGLLVTGARVVGVNQVGVTFMNVTAATVITPTAAESYLFFAARGLRVQPVMERILATLTPVSVAANTTAEQTFTVTGLVAATAVEVTKPSQQKGLALVGARVSALNTLALNYANVTANAITPPVEQYFIGFYPNVPPAAGSTNIQLASQGVEAGLALGNMGWLSTNEATGTIAGDASPSV